jgi:hypothetical protein
MGARPWASYIPGARKRNEREETVMTTKRAGEAAKAGFYFNTRTWEMDLHRKDGDALPGTDTDRYVRVPAAALLFVGPIMGFFFVIFLPFIGFALVARELAIRAGKLFGTIIHVATAAKHTTR